MKRREFIAGLGGRVETAARKFLGVLTIVLADAEHVSRRARNRRKKLHAGDRQRCDCGTGNFALQAVKIRDQEKHIRRKLGWQRRDLRQRLVRNADCRSTVVHERYKAHFDSRSFSSAGAT